jgi:hypothetical protein
VRYRFAVLGIATGLAAGLASTALAVPPPNDDFADGSVVSGFPVSVDGTNAEATNEPGEPSPFQPELPLPHSVWFRWTAPSSRHVAVLGCSDELRSDRSPAAGVWIGETLATLRSAGRSSHTLAPGCAKFSRGRVFSGGRVAFFAVAGQTYNIAVGTLEAGGLRLRIVPAGSVRSEMVPTRSGSRARLVYRAAPGERNRADFSLDWDPTDGVLMHRPEPPRAPVAFMVGSEESLSPGAGCALDVNASVACPIPGGLLSEGPLLYLGDGDDQALVTYSRARTVVWGGPGDDYIHAGGRMNGGPGDDQIFARPWVASRIRGGPGEDRITPSKRSDVIDPGPGIDRISGSGGNTHGRDVVNTRDGEIDYPLCFAGDVNYIDGLDAYPGDCGTVRRRGAPRAIPSDFGPITAFPESGGGEVRLTCPADEPDVCAGSFAVTRGERVFVRQRFRIVQFDGPHGETERFGFSATEREIRAMQGEVRITVRTREARGRIRTASGVYLVNAF